MVEPPVTAVATQLAEHAHRVGEPGERHGIAGDGVAVRRMREHPRGTSRSGPRRLRIARGRRRDRIEQRSRDHPVPLLELDLSFEYAHAERTRATHDLPRERPNMSCRLERFGEPSLGTKADREL